MKPTAATSRYEIIVEPDRLRITERPRGIRFDEPFWVLAIAGGSVGFLLVIFAIAIFVDAWRGANGAPPFGQAVLLALLFLAYPALVLLGIFAHFWSSQKLEIDTETLRLENRLFRFRRTKNIPRKNITKITTESQSGRQTAGNRVYLSFWNKYNCREQFLFTPTTVSEQKLIFEAFKNFLLSETNVTPKRHDVPENEAGRLRVRCIRCDSLLSAENVSLRHAMAKCPNCEILFTLEHDLKRHPIPPLTRLKPDRTAERLEIRQKRRWFSGLCLLGTLAFLYGLIVFALSMSWWAYNQGHEFDQLRQTIYLSTAVSLFVGIPIFLFAYRCLFLTKRLTIYADTVRYRWNLFPFFGAWSAPTAEFSDVFYDSQASFRRGVRFQCDSKQCRLSAYGLYEEHLWIISEIRHFLADLPQAPVQRLAGRERNEPIVDGFCPTCRHRYGVSEYDFVADKVRCGQCATETPIDEIFFLEDRSRFELDLTEPEPPEEERRIEPAYRIEEDAVSLTLRLEPNQKAFWPILFVQLGLHSFLWFCLGFLVLSAFREGKPGILVPTTLFFLLLCWFGRMLWFSFKWDIFGHWTVQVDRETIFCEARCLGYRRVVQRFRNELDKILVGSVPPGYRVSNETVPGEGRRLIFRFKDGSGFAMPLSQGVKMSQEYRDDLLRRINGFLVSK